MYDKNMFFDRLSDFNVVSKELTAATGISPGNISDWKKGRSKPSIDTIIKIADYLNCSIDYLLVRTDNKPINPLSADFFRLLLSDRGINAIKPALKKRIDAYGYENLERETGLSLMEIKLFLTTDIEAGTKGIAKLDLLLSVLETNVYDLLNESVDEKHVKYDVDTSGEIAAYKGKETRAIPPKINREITLPQK